jgi:hypothetical protein
MLLREAVDDAMMPGMIDRLIEGKDYIGMGVGALVFNNHSRS